MGTTNNPNQRILTMEKNGEHGEENRSGQFRQIGDHLPQVSPMPGSEASTPTPRPRSSGTTTSARAASLPTSTPPGASGVSSPSRSPSVADNDRAVEASLPRPLLAMLKATADNVHLSGEYGFEGTVLRGYDLRTPKNAAGWEMVAEGLAILDAALVPAERGTVRNELARLKIATKSRAQDGNDMTFEQAVYLDELSSYPVDVVVEACRKWARRETFWPSVSEAVAECDRLVNWRRVTRDALARMAQAQAVDERAARR